MKLLAFILSIPAWALSNRVVIYDDVTVLHTAQPFSVSRVFAEGEIADYPQPFVDGVSPAVWQVDVRTRYTDGSCKHAVISFSATILAGGSIAVDFRNNASSSSAGTYLSKAAMLAFNGGLWGARTSGTASGINQYVSARTVLSAVSECPANEWSSSGCFKYWMAGPAVTQIILFPGPSNSFGWECDSGGGTCPAVSPYTSTVWKSPTDPKYNSIHPIFVLTFYTGWAGVKIDFILENSWYGRLQDQKFDIELFTGVGESDSRWTSPGRVFYANRRAKKVFWDGTAPTGWTSEYRPGYHIDYNRQYMLYSKAVPFTAPNINALGNAGTYDLDSTALNLDIVHNIGTATEAQFCESTGANCGPQAYGWPQGGTKPELSILNRGYSRYMVSFSGELYEVMLQLGLMAGAFPLHIRESDTSLTYTAGSAANAFGKPFSLDARPQIRLAKDQTGVPVGSRISLALGEGVVGTIACLDSTRPFTIGCTVTDNTQIFNRWTIDDAHSPRAAYFPYIITGDWYFLEEQQFAANQLMADELLGSVVTPGCTTNFARHGEAGVGNDWGIPHSSHNIRVEAWGTLHIGQTTLSVPDSTPEKLYYTDRLMKIINARRGMLNITPEPSDYNSGGSAGDPCPSGSYDPATATPWCWGFVSRMERNTNPLALSSIQGTYTGWGLNLLPACASNMWFENYTRTVYGFLRHAGVSELEPLLALMSKSMIKQAIQSNAKGPTLTDFSTMIRVAATNQPPQSIAELVTGVKPETTVRVAINSSDLTLAINNQMASVNCSLADSVWLGGIQKYVIDPGTVDEEFVESNGQPSCQAVGTYTIPLFKRGVMGSTAKAHSVGAIFRRAFLDYGSTADTDASNGYGNVMSSAISYAFPYTAIDEVTGAALSGRRANQWAQTLLTYQNQMASTTCGSPIAANNCQNAAWVIRPIHTIDNTRSVVSGSSATFWYTAPTGDSCAYNVSATPFASTDSTGDTSTTGPSLARTFTATGLTSGTNYYRITCGPFGGTARVSGTISVP